ncbi:MAG: bacteriohemerythrin [bacterium]
MLLKWKDDLLVGVGTIDDQHKELFDMVNKLSEASNTGQSKEVIKDMIDFLGNYVIDHFSQEEALQQKYNYPKYTEHKAKHEAFIAQFVDVKNKIEAEGINIKYIIQVNQIIATWLVTHVSKVDKELGAFLKDKL